MITKYIDKNFLDDLFNKQYARFKEMKGSDLPIELFKFDEGMKINEDTTELSDYLFNEDNWNSGQDLLRYFFLNFYDNNVEIHKSWRLTVDVLFKEDSWIGVIIDNHNNDIYLSKWYKSRGTTSIITKNAENINLEEYIEILNKLNYLNLLDFLNIK